jgi:cobalt-zinc-cadmium efflux system membrane fusion protein
MKTLSIIAFAASVLLAAPFIQSCSDASGKDISKIRVVQHSDVTQNGMVITFPDSSTNMQRFKTTSAKEGKANVNVDAPARVVATMSSSLDKGKKGNVVLFENPDITSLFSQYRQNKTTLSLNENNLTRVREMFNNQGVTAKEVNQAEADVATARASASEMEARLRTAGFNPLEVESSPAGSVWIVSDVPESQLHNVEHGESVDIMLSSFPNDHFTGRVEAIGDAVDASTRTVKVRVSMKNSAGKLLPGMFAKVDFTEPQDHVIALPPTAIVTVEGKDYAFVQTANNRFERRTVTVISSLPEQVIVASGLKQGEQVVTEGAILLKGLSFGF